jgi:hypothetical protein
MLQRNEQDRQGCLARDHNTGEKKLKCAGIVVRNLYFGAD